MAEKQKLRTTSFVHVGDNLVASDALNEQQCRKLATWLKTTYLNTLFKGKAEFFENIGEAEQKEANR